MVMPVPSLVAPVTIVVAIATPLLLTAPAATAASAIGIGCPIEGLDGSTTKKKKRKESASPGQTTLLKEYPSHPDRSICRCSYVPRPPR